ncbi:MAG: hypothetical protein H7320_06010, partial [Ferruginibacter sp.]|nr:hypothetical protein [Ferruginibacter sp.]
MIIKSLLHTFLCMLVFQPVMAQDNMSDTTSRNTYFTVEKKYLVLPVKNGALKRNLELWVDGVNTRFFDMELA